jgi:dTMP kinase
MGKTMVAKKVQRRKKVVPLTARTLVASQYEFWYFDPCEWDVLVDNRILLTSIRLHTMLITFEGLDYSGKSTQVKMLSDRITLQGHRVLVLREPGGTEIGEKIRKILLDKENISLTDASELFLFSASRSQLVKEVILPALEGKMTVICDRYDDSTTAYQGYGRSIDLAAITAINKFATGGLEPDLTFFLDIPIREIEKRIARAKANRDRMESNDIGFYERVRNGYLAIAQQQPRYRVLDGLKSIDDLHDKVWQEVDQLANKK